MSDKEPNEFERFDRIMSGLIAVPHAELQKELAKDRKKKARTKQASAVPGLLCAGRDKYQGTTLASSAR